MAAAVLSAALLLVAAPASAADDAWELDTRLADLGIEDPWTTVDAVRGPGGPSVVVGVLYRSEADEPAALRREGARVAEVIWDHAGYRVVRVLVQADAPAPWSGEALPEPLLLDRPELEERFGARPAGLDAQGLGELAEDPELGTGTLGWLGTGLVLAAFVVGAALAWLVTFLFLRGRRVPGQRGPLPPDAGGAPPVPAAPQPVPPYPVPPYPVPPGAYGPPGPYRPYRPPGPYGPYGPPPPRRG